MFSFFVTVAEGAEGPSSGFEVIGRENLLNSMKGGHKKPWTISLHNHTILIHHKQNYFIQHTMSDSFTKKTVAARGLSRKYGMQTHHPQLHPPIQTSG